MFRMVTNLGPFITKTLNMKRKFTKDEYKEDYVYIRQTMIGSEALENIGNIGKILSKYRIETEKAITSKEHGITGEYHDGLELDSCHEGYIMFTPDQLDIYKNSNSKYCVLEGDYGTGKTYILKVN